MYGQLTAVAREFNFPSITGLCLYLHLSDQGPTSAPRISDSSWQCLWARWFEARSQGYSPTNFQFPIAGRVEFDIDLDKARWYASWLASSYEGCLEKKGPSAFSQMRSMAHCHSESKIRPGDCGPDDIHHTTAASFYGQPPRKLSLLDRLESLDASGFVLGQSEFAASSPCSSGGAQMQNFVPHTGGDQRNHMDLERMKLWQDNVSVRTPLAMVDHQSSLGTTNTTNALSHNSICNPGIDSLGFEGFRSISSAGPASCHISPASRVSRV